jgi:hypothetical protein
VTSPDLYDDDAPALTAHEARELTDHIKADVEALWDLITQAYRGRAWIALNYESWDVYCIEEFGAGRLKIPREERAEIVTSLRHAGLSVRAISSATGLGRGTVHREIEPGVPNGTPEPETVDLDVIEPTPIKGRDGKTYPPTKPTTVSVTVVDREPSPPGKQQPNIGFVITARGVFDQAKALARWAEHEDFQPDKAGAAKGMGYAREAITILQAIVGYIDPDEPELPSLAKKAQS